ncbi:MAG: 6-bladed beta-propeller, partial [Bacteroidales bacterium]|nr:6-bladed beta-propeller [Bacteroidales bacterium]
PLFLMLCLFSKCQVKNPLGNFTQVAQKEGDLTICDVSLLEGTVNLPLSSIAGELKIVKLDDSDAALVKPSFGISLEIGDKYILVNGSREIPYKLFEKKTGKFITNIGAYGQGPNEYKEVYDSQLDEENNRIYLLPWSTDKILMYDLQGNYLDPIPLCYRVTKGKFNVDTKK